MLYDPKWEVQTDIWAIQNLVRWLEQQPANETYVYCCSEGCLLAQYLISRGWQAPIVGGISVSDSPKGPQYRIPREWNAIAQGNPRTYGAALDRACAKIA